MSERLLDDALLVNRAQGGDRSAFDALVTKHQARAYQYAYRLCRDQEQASDIVSEGFLRVYNALSHFKGQSSFITWLYRIMTNCFLDHKKRIKNKRHVSLDAVMQVSTGEVERQFEDESPTPYEVAESSSRTERIDAAVQELPEFQQAMVIMYHAELMSYEEIAVALDLPVGTVKSRLNRARLNLRLLLVEDEELLRG